MLIRQKSGRRRRKEGQIVKIPLFNGSYSLGIVLKEPLVSFFDKILKDEDDVVSIDNMPVAFTLMVMNDAVTSGRWVVVGNSTIPERLKAVPKFCKQDQVSGALSIYHEIPDLAPHYERPALPGECADLEAAAVWEAEHVEDRLRDHFSGTPNKWVEQLRVR